MKIALHLLFLAILSAVLAGEAAYSATTDEAKERQKVKTVAQQADHDRVAKKTQTHGSASMAKPKHLPPPSRNNQKRLATGKLPDPQMPGPSRSTSFVNPGLVINKAASRGRVAQPPTTSRTSIPISNNVRHRSPNPTIVGGSTSLRAVNTGSLNGTRMGRKP
jgi:hypothetical protein